MNLRLAMTLLFVGLLAGCEGCGNDAPETDRTAASAAPGTSTGDEAVGEGEPAAAPDPGPPPALGLTIEAGFEGASALVVENRGTSPVELSSALVLERQDEQDGDSFEPAGDVRGLALRFDCDEAPPECLALVPGAALHPPPWNGKVGEGQCGCTDCDPAPTGTYRFVVTTCGGGHRVESPAFTR